MGVYVKKKGELGAKSEFILFKKERFLISTATFDPNLSPPITRIDPF